MPLADPLGLGTATLPAIYPSSLLRLPSPEQQGEDAQ